MGNDQPMRKLSHEDIAKTIENMDQRMITGIKIERWIAALAEFKNLFYCTAEDLRELRLAINEPSPDHTMEDRANKQVLNDKMEIVEYILNHLPRVIDHRIKPQPIILPPSHQ
jgi:hypothetical protein